ncbi:hypothetical protein HJC99_03090 [Candidatus Saccharibacteria bacterium]|nr:hypothetical protein [Candidatus Saccharibacteria bacterium]
MRTWNKLGLGSSGDSGTEPSDSAAPAEDMSRSHEVIHDSSGDAYWEQFESAIEHLSAKELNDLNYRLGAGVADFSNWHDYVDVFCKYEWYQFCEAYHWATGTSFSLES